MPESPRGCPRERWTGSSGVRCRPGSGGRRPSNPAGLPLAGWPHPLGAELVAAGTLASLGHRYLPPGPLRQFIAALLHGPVLSVSQLGLSGTAEALILCTGPSRLQRPHRAAAGDVQHVVHPHRRQLCVYQHHSEGDAYRGQKEQRRCPLGTPAFHPLSLPGHCSPRFPACGLNLSSFIPNPPMDTEWTA